MGWPSRDHLMEGLAELRSRGNVDLTDDGDDREASIDPLLNVKLLFHHTPVLVLDGSEPRTSTFAAIAIDQRDL